MYAAADLAWEGGNAQYGDEVDETTIPDAVRARFIDAGALVASPPEPREETLPKVTINLEDEIA